MNFAPFALYHFPDLHGKQDISENTPAIETATGQTKNTFFSERVFSGEGGIRTRDWF